ncbi:MAG: hypothetical protein IJJ99_06150 [Oscillospiraceae bacterium]|nr:hypothetical protein [Oscillospiraceae bacterium]
MKRLKRTICVLLLLCIAASVAACASDKCCVVLRKEDSWFSDFEVVGDRVQFKCLLCLKNTADRAQTVSVYGNFDEDVRGGLVKESRLLAHDTSEPMRTAFYISAGAEISVEVTFTGTFAGTMEKQDRLLPELEIVLSDGDVITTDPSDSGT